MNRKGRQMPPGSMGHWPEAHGAPVHALAGTLHRRTLHPDPPPETSPHTLHTFAPTHVKRVGVKVTLCSLDPEP